MNLEINVSYFKIVKLCQKMLKRFNGDTLSSWIGGHSIQKMILTNDSMYGFTVITLTFSA